MTNNNTNHQGLTELSEAVLKDISGGCNFDGGGCDPWGRDPYFPRPTPPKPKIEPFPIFW